jgi:hypothetical protein
VNILVPSKSTVMAGNEAAVPEVRVATPLKTPLAATTLGDIIDGAYQAA